MCTAVRVHASCHKRQSGSDYARWYGSAKVHEPQNQNMPITQETDCIFFSNVNSVSVSD